MKINIVRRKLIKPCTPTPQHLKNYTISFRDELSPPSNIGFVLFYQSKPKSTYILEESLSKILPHFYPLSGRYIKQDYTVDCSDQAIEFVEAVAEDEIVLEDSGEVDDLLPRRCDQFAGPNDPLLSIQITNLIKCLSVAIGVSVSHRIFDAYSIMTFVTAWSNANKNTGGEIAIVPSFDPRLLFPGKILYGPKLN